MKVSERLSEWGYWKNNYIVGIGFKAESIESKIQQKQIFGTGNYGVKSSPSIRVIENVRAEQVDIAIRKLKKGFVLEMELINVHYVQGQSLREIAKRTEKSKREISKLLLRSETLVEAAVSLEGILL